MNGGSSYCFNTGHGNSDVRFFTISVKRGKGGSTLTTNVRIVMSTYPMGIPLFPLQLETIGLLLSDDKVDGIWEKLSWGDRYGTSYLLQANLISHTCPPIIFSRIPSHLSSDSSKPIVAGCRENNGMSMGKVLITIRTVAVIVRLSFPHFTEIVKNLTSLLP